MTIFEKALDLISRGAKWNINLKERSLKVNGKYLIKNGEYEGELSNLPLVESDKFSVINSLEENYCRYKNSIPSERTSSKRRVYFRALKEHELTDDDMLYGSPREYEQFKLEFYVLEYAIKSIFDKYWDEWNMGKWFWQSSIDKDFVILRDWVIKK